jgi:hypothetical protein
MLFPLSASKIKNTTMVGYIEGCKEGQREGTAHCYPPTKLHNNIIQAIIT